MWRFYYVIIRNAFRLPFIIGRMRKMVADPNKYSEQDRYAYLQDMINLLKRTGHIQTEVYGTENLPAEGGYMMYSNHQGKYDAYGIVGAHEKPCSIVMDEHKSYYPLINEIIQMLKGKRLDRENVRQNISVIKEMTEEVQAGRCFILFPEGGYEEGTGNTIGEFKAGSFKIPQKSKTPIIPVAIIDSYKVFNSGLFGTIKTQVHFLKPILPEEYAGMKTKEMAELVKTRIQCKMDEVIRCVDECQEEAFPPYLGEGFVAKCK